MINLTINGFYFSVFLFVLFASGFFLLKEAYKKCELFGDVIFVISLFGVLFFGILLVAWIILYF